MIVEFSILPVGVGSSLSKYVAKAIEIVEESGLNYKLTAMGTILEGGYEEIMQTIEKCHHAVLEDCERVVTTIKIDERKGAENRMDAKVRSIERELGREVKK